MIGALPLEARTSQGQRAGLISRAAASLIDLFVGTAVLLGGYLAVAVLLFVLRPLTFRWPAPGMLILTIAGAAILIAYLVAGWTTSGRTLGSQVMGLRVVGRDGATLMFARASARAIVCVLFPIGLLWCAVDRRSRAAHDLLLGTSVIYDWRRRSLMTDEQSTKPPRGSSAEQGAGSVEDAETPLRVSSDP